MDDIIKVLKDKCLYFARWTSDFDCGARTEWWYCIRDKKIFLDDLTAKQRYRINRGRKNVSIKRIDEKERQKYVDDLYQIAVDSLSEYPAKYREIPSKDNFSSQLLNTKADVWIAVDKEEQKVCAYSLCSKQMDMVHLSVMKVMPDYLRKEVNAVFAFEICYYYLNELGLRYICDGERNIRHETNYQDFLVKVLGFRYAYCKLNVIYHPLVKIVVACLYPLRSLLKKMGVYSPFLYNIYCVLKQEQIVRSFK